MALSSDGFDRAEMKPREMRLQEAMKGLLRTLRCGPTEGAQWRITAKDAVEGDYGLCEQQVGVKLAFNLNNHPNGERTGITITIRLTDRVLTVEEARAFQTLMEMVGPAFEEIERDFADVRVRE